MALITSPSSGKAQISQNGELRLSPSLRAARFIIHEPSSVAKLAPNANLLVPRTLQPQRLAPSPGPGHRLAPVSVTASLWVLHRGCQSTQRPLGSLLPLLLGVPVVGAVRGGTQLRHRAAPRLRRPQKAGERSPQVTTTRGGRGRGRAAPRGTPNNPFPACCRAGTPLQR